MIRALALTLLLMPGAAAAEDTNLPALHAAATQATALPDTDAMLAACPADLYNTRANPLRKLFAPDWEKTWANCQQDIAACAAACSQSQDGDACLDLAS